MKGNKFFHKLLSRKLKPNQKLLHSHRTSKPGSQIDLSVVGRALPDFFLLSYSFVQLNELDFFQTIETRTQQKSYIGKRSVFSIMIGVEHNRRRGLFSLFLLNVPIIECLLELFLSSVHSCREQYYSWNRNLHRHGEFQFRSQLTLSHFSVLISLFFTLINITSRER